MGATGCGYSNKLLGDAREMQLRSLTLPARQSVRWEVENPGGDIAQRDSKRRTAQLHFEPTSNLYLARLVLKRKSAHRPPTQPSVEFH